MVLIQGIHLVNHWIETDGIASCEDPDDGEIYVSPLVTPGVNGPEATWQVKKYRTVRHFIG